MIGELARFDKCPTLSTFQKKKKKKGGLENPRARFTERLTSAN